MEMILTVNETDIDKNPKERLFYATTLLIDTLLNDTTTEPTETEINANKWENKMEEVTMKGSNEEIGEWLTPNQAAELVGTVTARTISKWARQGLLPARRVNRRWYVHKRKLQEMLNFYDEDNHKPSLEE